MFFSQRRKKSTLTGQRKVDLYPHNLQFYKFPPLDTISLEEFEKLALERLQVLRIVERIGTKFTKGAKAYMEAMHSELMKHKLSMYYRITVNNETLTDHIYDERRKDHISHFILRLAYCRREDLRRWFITQEVDLFRYRFRSDNTQGQKLFMEVNNLNYKPIDEAEKKLISEHLLFGSINSVTKVNEKHFYKLPFTEVLDLVGKRNAGLRKGYAYITEEDLVSHIVTSFRVHLSQALAQTSRALPQLEEDTRLLNMLSTIHERYIGTDYSSNRRNYTGDVAPEVIDALAKTSFPLCMQTLHENLRKTHHLKYNGRLQYGLFLKGIGLTLEDALRFWREEFTKVMDMDKFDKQYSYNIRYNYGKEGKRANFSPYSCMKIITSNAPGPGEVHGCPFKHSDDSNLKLKLQNMNIDSSGIKDILELKSKSHYQIACTRYFELVHQEMNGDAINHPNQYFEASQKIKKGIQTNEKRPRNTANITTTRCVVPSQSDMSSEASSATPLIDDCDIDGNFPMDDLEELLKGV